MFFPADTFFNDLSNHKPRIGASACVLGENVRYDGKSKYLPEISNFFSQEAILTPICPEVGAGLSVPRPPVQLVETGGNISMLGVNDSNLDVTTQLLHFSSHIQQSHQGAFQAILLKARSPSCGIYSTPIVDRQGKLLRYGSGLFTAILRQKWDATIFIEEESLQTIEQRNDLLLRCYFLLDIQLTLADNQPLLLQHYQQRFCSANTLPQLLQIIIQNST